jgi:hypothetical protein
MGGEQLESCNVGTLGTSLLGFFTQWPTHQFGNRITH